MVGGLHGRYGLTAQLSVVMDNKNGTVHATTPPRNTEEMIAQELAMKPADAS